MAVWRAARAGLVVLSLCLGACTTSGSDRADPTRSIDAPVDLGGGSRLLHLDQPRAVHHATVLEDGRVLFTGGCTAPGCGGFEEAQMTEIFDPQRATFEAGPAMLQPRAGGTATRLNDGRVLLTGGYPGEGQPPMDSAEVYSPRSDTFLSTSSMTTPRADQTATLLADGQVLIAGGVDATGEPIATTELFDPRTDEFDPGFDLSEPRASQSAVLVGASVLLVGGTQAGRALDTTDLLQDEMWLPGPDLLTARTKLGAAALDDTRILVVGGASSTEGRTPLRTTEIIDIRAGTALPGPELSQGQYKLDGAVTRLADGRIAVAGGDRVDLYDPASNTMTTLDRPTMGTRSFVSATALGTWLLVAGGYDPAIEPTDEAWLIPVP